FYDHDTVMEHRNHVHVAGSEGSLRELLATVRADEGLVAGSDVPPYPLSDGNVFGLITGPERVHGGIHDSERAEIKNIQVRLQERGYAPNTAGWADGVFEQPTADAVMKFQTDRKLAPTGEVDAATWDSLFAPK